MDYRPRSLRTRVSEQARSPRKSWGFPTNPAIGFVLARGPNGEVDFFTKGYIRYLNQLNLDHFYTDSFGRTIELDLRQDIQLNRLQVEAARMAV